MHPVPQKGELVTVSPEHCTSFERSWNSFTRDNGEGLSMTVQVINYCFGHPESSVLIWPYATVVNLINHDGASSNVVVRWPTTANSLLGGWIRRSKGR